jgi:hypothetical protein
MVERVRAAVEDDGALAIDGVGRGGEGDQLHVTRPRDVARLALVGLAHVDHLQRRLPREPVGDPRRLDLDSLWVLCARHDSRA